MTESRSSPEIKDDKTVAHEAYMYAYEALVGAVNSRILTLYRDLRNSQLAFRRKKAETLKNIVGNLDDFDDRWLGGYGPLVLKSGGDSISLDVSYPEALGKAFKEWRNTGNAYLTLEHGQRPGLRSKNRKGYNERLAGDWSIERKNLITRIRACFGPAEASQPAVPKEPEPQPATPEPKKQDGTPAAGVEAKPAPRSPHKPTLAETAADSPEKTAYRGALAAFIATAQQEIKDCYDRFLLIENKEVSRQKVTQLKDVVATFARFKHFSEPAPGRTRLVLLGTSDKISIDLPDKGARYHGAHATYLNTFEALMKKEYPKEWKNRRRHDLSEEVSFDIAPTIRTTLGAAPESQDLSADTGGVQLVYGVRGLGLLPDNYETLDNRGKKLEREKIKRQLFEIALEKYILMHGTVGPETEAPWFAARNAYLTFVFHMEGREAARTAEGELAAWISNEIRDRRWKDKHPRFIYGALQAARNSVRGMMYAAGTAAGGTVAWAFGKLASYSMGVALWLPIYHLTYDFLLWITGHNQNEKDAQNMGQSWERFKDSKKERSKWIRRKYLKIAAGTLASAISAGTAIALDQSGFNAFVGGAVSEWLDTLSKNGVYATVVAPIVGRAGSLIESIQNCFNATTPSPSGAVEATPTSGPPASPEAPSGPAGGESSSGGSEAGAGSGAEAAGTAAGGWPVEIPIKPDGGEGFTQLLQGLQGSGPVPEWLRGIGGSPEAWQAWATAQGLMDSSGSTFLYASDTFHWASDGSLMIDTGGGHFETAIDKDGVVQQILRSRAKV